jgi:hypothetical protein
MFKQFCVLFSFFIIVIESIETGGDSARFFNIPMHEILQNELYMKVSEFGEVVVTYTERGSDLRPDDYITHADGIRILSGGLDDFLKSDEREVIVPVVEDSDSKFGGNRLLGFVMLQVVQPRKLSSRRGDIVFDMEEGGPPPSMKLGTIASRMFCVSINYFDSIREHRYRSERRQDNFRPVLQTPSAWRRRMYHRQGLLRLQRQLHQRDVRLQRDSDWILLSG